MQARGGTIIEHGDTHQYSNVPNPYDAVTGDDFEFYQSWCSTTFGGPADPTSPCPNTDYVVQGGPLPNDSQAWAQARVARGQSLFAQAGLPTPAIWETPHYAASAADYAGIAQVFSIRYERGKYFGGQLSGGSIDYTHEFEQFFPYVVHDINGSTVLPEDLGNYEPDASNNNPPRPPSVIIANAQAELAVRQGVASFFFHPYYGVSYLQQIVQGIQALGYTFVSPQSLLGPGQSVSVPVTVTSTSLPAATAGQAYSATLTAADGTAPYKWSVTSGSLPAGLKLNASTGAITGTPTGAGTSTVTVAATDSTTTASVGSTAGSTVAHSGAPASHGDPHPHGQCQPVQRHHGVLALRHGKPAVYGGPGGGRRRDSVCLVGQRVAEGPQPEPGYRVDQRSAHHRRGLHREGSSQRRVPTRP